MFSYYIPLVYADDWDTRSCGYEQTFPDLTPIYCIKLKISQNTINDVKESISSSVYNDFTDESTT